MVINIKYGEIGTFKLETKYRFFEVMTSKFPLDDFQAKKKK